jgi:dihydrodipicolinate synthase/N-acetylneuraminate lyase
MTFDRARENLGGCYITVPTMFEDPDLDLNLPAIRRHVEFLTGRGINAENAVLLAGGAAGDFSTLSFDERLQVTETVIAAADGKVPVAMGAQTTNTRELILLAKSAKRLGAQFIQVSCPYYFNHSEGDFEEYVIAAAEAADIAIIIYNTFWTSSGVSLDMIDKLAEIPNVVGLKWATPRTDAMEFEDAVSHFAERLCIIDNNLLFSSSHMMGARAFEVHLCNYWPEWGIKLLADLEAGNYVEVQRAMVEEAMPYYKLWTQIENDYTSGDGYLDKLCMELVGLDSSRCRPPTRDVRGLYREQTQQMLIQTGVPNVVAPGKPTVK